MTQIYCQVNLFTFANLRNDNFLRIVVGVLLDKAPLLRSLLHKHRDELIADFWRLLCCVAKTVIFGLHVVSQLRIAFELFCDVCIFAELFAPPVFVEALPKQDHEWQRAFLVVGWGHDAADSVEVEGKDFVHFHLLPLQVVQVVIILRVQFYWDFQRVILDDFDLAWLI